MKDTLIRFTTGVTPFFIKTRHSHSRVRLSCLFILALMATSLFAAPLPQNQLKKGMLLIATKNLAGTSFQETVILITKYSKYGAMGLAINKPSARTTSELFPTLKSSDIPDKLHLGGPINQKAMLLLIKSVNPHEIQTVIENVYFISGKRALKKMMKNIAPTDTVRTFAGYSGWSPGQLETELKNGYWKIIQADNSSIFDDDTDSLWQRLSKSLIDKWV